MCRLSRNSGNLNFMNPLASVQACIRIALPLLQRKNRTLSTSHWPVSSRTSIKNVSRNRELLQTIKFSTCGATVHVTQQFPSSWVYLFQVYCAIREGGICNMTRGQSQKPLSKVTRWLTWQVFIGKFRSYKQNDNVQLASKKAVAGMKPKIKTEKHLNKAFRLTRFCPVLYLFYLNAVHSAQG